MFFVELLKGLAALAAAITFIFTGLSFGHISLAGCATLWKDEPKKFNILFARGYITMYSVYFSVIIAVSAYQGLHDTFIIICSFFAVLIGIVLTAMIETGYSRWAFALGLSGLPLLIKCALSSYFVTDHILTHDLDGEFTFLLCSLITEMILVLLYSLWPFLTVQVCERKETFQVFAMWQK